ncbi:MAG: hypothetical protein KDE56_14740 [Anaerolineales bacterium]|nr:hypothetical protein [Anaerolineales bacterium]
MIAADATVSDRVTQIFKTTRVLTTSERLVLAKLLLDSLIEEEQEAEHDWHRMGLTAFETEWDNPEDAIYDNWREHYGISSR